MAAPSRRMLLTCSLTQMVVSDTALLLNTFRLILLLKEQLYRKAQLTKSHDMISCSLEPLGASLSKGAGPGWRQNPDYLPQSTVTSSHNSETL